MTDLGSAAPLAVVIDDDDDVRHLLVQILTSAGFSPIAVNNGIAGVEAVATHRPVITTLDVNMPGIDGFETARRIREISDTYILLITALADEADAVLGFSVGVDDVVVKPFRARELRARVSAILRRARVPLAVPAEDTPAPAATPDDTSSGHVLRQDGLVLDLDHHTLTLDGEEVALTRSEFDLLATLLGSERRVRSKADLVLTLRDESHLSTDIVTEAEERAIEAHITNLRRKLGESAAHPRFIETVRGAGYRAVTPRRQTQPVPTVAG